MAGWPAVVTAVSLALLTLTLIVVGVTAFLVLRRLITLERKITRLIETLEGELIPIVERAGGIAEASYDMVDQGRDIVDRLAGLPLFQLLPRRSKRDDPLQKARTALTAARIALRMWNRRR